MKGEKIPLVIGITVFVLLIPSILSAQDRFVIAQSQGGEEWAGQTIALRFLKSAYEEIGISFEVLDLPAERALVMANSGEVVAGIAARMEGLEEIYPNIVLVPVPVAYLEMMVYTRDLVFEVPGWEYLRPYRITFMRGNKLAEQSTQGMIVDMVPTPEHAFQMLINGRTDIVIENRDNRSAMKHLADGEISVMEPPLEKISVYHYLNKRYANDLLPRLESILLRLHAAGIFERISEEVMQEFVISDSD